MGLEDVHRWMDGLNEIRWIDGWMAKWNGIE